MHKVRTLLVVTLAGIIATVLFLTQTTPSMRPTNEAAETSVGVAADPLRATTVATSESMPAAVEGPPSSGGLRRAIPLALIGSDWSSGPEDRHLADLPIGPGDINKRNKQGRRRLGRNWRQRGFSWPHNAASRCMR